MKPKIKTKAPPAVKKLPPPKKMSPSERVLATIANHEAIHNTVNPSAAMAVVKTGAKPKIKSTGIANPRVFHDCHRRTFILLSEGHGFNRYLTTRDEGLQVIKLEDGKPARDEKGELKTQETTCVCELSVCPDRNGEPYDLKKASQRLWDSGLDRSTAAVKELCLILGKPVPEISEAVKTARKEAGERLKKAKRAPLPKPGDEVMVALAKGAKEGSGPSERANKVLKILSRQKKGLIVTELSEMIGKPVGAAVAKLIAAGLVTEAQKGGSK